MQQRRRGRQRLSGEVLRGGERSWEEGREEGEQRRRLELARRYGDKEVE